MKVVDIKDIEDCFDGSFIKELLLDDEMNKDFVKSLAELGELKYFADFSRPFFKLRVGKQAELKGVEGNRTLRVLLYSEKGKVWLDSLIDWICGRSRQGCM